MITPFIRLVRSLIISFVRPRRRLSPAPTAVLSQAGARRWLSRLAALQRPPLRGLGLYSNRARRQGLIGRVDYTPVCYLSLSVFVSARVIPITECCFLAGLATKSMARAIIASTYIRQLRSGLPRCCLHGRSRRRGWDSSLGRQIGKCRFAIRFYSHTSDPPDTPETGVSELSACRRYRVRIAPCGTRPCSR